MVSVSIKKNYLYNTLCQLLGLLIPFITTPYVSRILGAESIGKYSYASAIATIFALFAAFGSDTYGQRSVAYHRDNKTELSIVFWNTFSFRLILGVCTCGAYFGYVAFFEGINTLNIIVALSILNVIIDMGWFYQGLEEFKGIAFRNLSVRVFCLIGIFQFVKGPTDLWKYVLILMLSAVLGSLSMWWKLPKYVSFPRTVRPFEPFKESFFVFIPSIAIQIYTVLDKAMIGWVTGSNYQNGCYEQSERIARLALTLVTSVGTVVLPRVANLYHKKNLDQAKEYIYKAINVVWLLSLPMMFGLSIVASIFIPLFLGEGFDLAVKLLRIFSCLIPFVSLAHIIGVCYLIPTKQQNVYTVAVTLAACVNFVLNAILIPLIGALGAAIASVIAEFIGVGIETGYCIAKKQLKIKQLFGRGYKYLIAGMLMYCVLLFFKPMMPINAFGLCLEVFLGIIAYFVILFVLKDELTIQYLSILFRKVRRKNQ